MFVLGEAQKPGSYTVSGLSTMTNALFVSGGVKKIGSLRNIQLKRDGRLISTLDLYDMLLRGDNSGDHQLLPGDVIFIPPIGNTVSVYGSVRRPAIYELKGEKTAEQVDPARGRTCCPTPIRISDSSNGSRSPTSHQMHNIDLTSAARPFAGDGERRQVADSGDPADARELGQARGLRVPARSIRLPPGSAALGRA